MKIYVDADGCPVVNIAIKLAKEYGLEIIVVKNYAHRIVDDYAEIVSIDISRDSADFFIINKVNKGDIVITQDYGLAAICLSKSAIPINQNGLVYTNNNIDGMLNQRHIHRELRQQGKHHAKAKKRKLEANKTFENNFRRLIEKSMMSP